MKSDKHSWQQRAKDHLASVARPLIVVLGPTGSGKTEFSIQLAQLIATEPGRSAEIINADSRQLYRGMDIGTAKITKNEMQGIPHHLLDLLDPDQEAAAGWYRNVAIASIASIHSRGGVPILVGGSMLYLSAVIDGLSLAPVKDHLLRLRLEQEYTADKGASLYARLQSLDPQAAARIHQNNMPHLVRAVEICELSGQPKSHTVSTGAAHDFDMLIFGMQISRDDLVVKINNRTASMLRSGWFEEVSELMKCGYTAEDPGMKASGYKEIMRFLRDGAASPIEELATEIAKKTRQYARRQMTWWKGDERIFWIPKT